MLKKFLNHINQIILLYLLMLLNNITIIAQTYDEQYIYTYKQIQNYLNYLKLINRPSLIDTAASRGSLGVDIAIAGQLLKLNPNDSLSIKIFNPNTTNTNLLIPKIYISKGTYFPIHFAVSIGKAQTIDLTQIAYYIQWCIYEDFLMPAFALRFASSFNQSLKYKIKQNTESLDFIISYGLYYISAYAGYGLINNNIKINLDSIYGYGLNLTNTNNLIHHNNTNFSAIYGLKFNWTTNLNFNLEIITYDQKQFNTNIKFNAQL